VWRISDKIDKDCGKVLQDIDDIKKNRMKLMEFVRGCDSDPGPSNHKSMKKSLYREMDVTLLHWFNQKQAEGTSVYGPMCAPKATYIHDGPGLNGEFDASIG
jgi:hypothetical protein